MQVPIRRLVMFAVPWFATSAVALVSLPNPAISDSIILGGRSLGGSIDGRATKVIATGCAVCPVVISFAACPDIQLSTIQEPGVTVDCAAATVTTMTNAAGSGTPRLGGAAKTPPPSDPAPPG